MVRAFVSVGSNINPAENVERAIRLLAREVPVMGISTVYQTEAEGSPGQPQYYNCVVEIETELPPRKLKFEVLRGIEDALGRKRGFDKFAARTIDLDLIIYDELEMNTEELTLPDPDITRRPFIAVPLHELAPDLALPGSGLRIEEAVAALSHPAITMLESYTKHLRKEILHERKQ
jgi:dihydroneopterin aldolase/2-amino-4-hydroxy-6-hydroxymethyldihydropteridine diphosphokinase